MAYRGTRINPAKLDRSQLGFYLVLVPFAAFMLLPLVYVLNQALKPIEELFAFPPRFLVARPTLRNFRVLFGITSLTGMPMSRYLFNSVTVCLAAVLLSLVVSVAAGYVLSKKRYRPRRAILAVNQTALMFVPVAAAIPRYLVLVNLGLIDTFWVHVLPVLAMPVGLFLVKQFIDQIPDSLIESVKMDGGGDFRIIRSIVIPMARPALATVGILTFQAVWSAVEPSTLYIHDETLRTASYFLSALTSRYGNTISGAGITAAAFVLLLLPNIAIFIILQSRIMNTMAHSGIK